MEISLPTRAVPVRCDRIGYQLALSNLVSNAVKYTRSGSITVQLFVKDSGAVLRVKADQLRVVHLVDVITGQHDDVFGPLFFDRVDVLIDGIGGPLIPVFVDPLLGWDHVDELAEFPTEISKPETGVIVKRFAAIYLLIYACFI